MGQPSTAVVYNSGGDPTFAGVRGEKLHITSSGVNMGVRYNVPTIVGKEYRITLTVGGDPGSIFISSTSGNIFSGTDLAGDEVITFTALDSLTFVFIRANNNTAGQTDFDNIVIRERITFIDGEPEGYTQRESSILLGNATKAKKSSIYYRAKEITNIQL